MLGSFERKQRMDIPMAMHMLRQTRICKLTYKAFRMHIIANHRLQRRI